MKWWELFQPVTPVVNVENDLLCISKVTCLINFD